MERKKKVFRPLIFSIRGPPNVHTALSLFFLCTDMAPILLSVVLTQKIWTWGRRGFLLFIQRPRILSEGKDFPTFPLLCLLCNSSYGTVLLAKEKKIKTALFSECLNKKISEESFQFRSWIVKSCKGMISHRNFM